MTDELLQEISSKLSTLIEQQGNMQTAIQDLTLKVNTIDFYFGILVGVLIGFIFWNIQKEVGK